jgi:hypothetical protein
MSNLEVLAIDRRKDFVGIFSRGILVTKYTTSDR